MAGEPPIDDDPVIRRVAAARPSIDEDELSPTSPRASAMLERILAAPAPGPAGRRWRRPRRTLPWVGLALAPVAAVAVVVLLVAGVFSGPDSTGTQTASAAVLKATLRALSVSPGTIVIQEETTISGPSVHGHPYTEGNVIQTPSGPGAQNNLFTTTMTGGIYGHPPVLSAYSYIGGEQAVYSPTANTIYESSIWGPYLHPGSRPGTFVYRYAKGSPIPPSKPVTVSRDQERALLRGDAVISINGATNVATVQPPERIPQTFTAQLRSAIANHVLHVVGPVTVDGRSAIKIAGGWGPGNSLAYVYLDPKTHLPFEMVDYPGHHNQSITRMSQRTLPITTANERLLSLQAIHPTARVDRSHSDFVRVAGESVYPT